MKRFYTKCSLLITLFIGMYAPAAIAQCDGLSLPSSITACPYTTITLNPTITGPYTVVDYFWSPSTGLSDPKAQSPSLYVTYTRNYTLQILASKGVNLVTNGNFSGGNTGFSSDYVLETTGPSTADHYAITTDPSPFLASFPAMGDHTSGTGNMMLVDGATDSANKVWYQAVTVKPFTYYQVVAWAAPLTNPPAGLIFSINGGKIGQTFLLDGPVAGWVKFSYIWFSGGSATANLAINDSDILASGNDFVLDDIQMYELCSNIASVNVVVPKFKPTILVDKGPCSLTVNLTGLDSSNNAIKSKNWDLGDGGTDTGTNVKHTYATDGGYTIKLTETDTNGCVDSAVLRETINTITTNVKGAGDTVVCKGIVVQLSAMGAKTYSWSPAAGLNDSTLQNPQASPTVPTPYVVTGIDSNGCIGKDTVVIGLLPAPTLHITPVTDPITCSNSSVQLFVSGAHKYIWQPGLLCDSNTSSHPIVTPQSTTTFYVTGSDGKGCTSVDSITIYSLKDSAYIPNAFTPNGDGINDVIYPTSYCQFIFESFNVYNRWGQLVFSTKMEGEGWDGKLNGQPQPEGVYIYYVTGYKVDEGKVERTHTVIKGNITLLR